MVEAKPSGKGKGWTIVDLRKLGILPKQQFELLQNIQNVQKNLVISLQPLAAIASTKAFQDILKIQEEANKIKIPTVKIVPHQTLPTVTVNRLVRSRREVRNVEQKTDEALEKLLEELKKQNEKLESEVTKFEVANENFSDRVETLQNENTRLSNTITGLNDQVTRLKNELVNVWKKPQNWGLVVMFGAISGLAVYLIITALSS